MISVDTARLLIRQHIAPLPAADTPLLHAFGQILSEPITAPIDAPPFHQSAMDGYAFRFSDLENSPQFLVTQEIQAGDWSEQTLGPAEAARIFTGAPIPPGADTVVMQEKTRREGNTLFIEDDLLKSGGNVRPKGSQTTCGETAVSAGQVVSPAVAGFLAGIGISQVKAIPLPKVSIINTGKELQTPGQALLPGQIYESNSVALIAALQSIGIRENHTQTVGDDPALIAQAIQDQLQHCDLLLLTGGVSVGAYDFVQQALLACGVQQVFHKVKQKPGKPLFFGMYGPKPVFGLPGNPAAVLSCFYEYVAAAIAYLTARSTPGTIEMPLTNAFEKKAGLFFFLKGKITSDGVKPLHAQESYQMGSFSEADCLIHLPEESALLPAGTLVHIRKIL
jgi:molybdopterin molybdotransferase